MPQIPISNSKITPPSRRPQLLTRMRLLSLLNEAVNLKLTLISAPAGYGKTSLLIDFIHKTEKPCCWLTLDELDREPQRFATYFIASIAKVFSDFGMKSYDVLNKMNSFEEEIERLITTITNELREHILKDFILIIDDLHLIENISIITLFLNRFTQLMPENCHLIFSSRKLLELPELTLMIARGQASGIDFSDLAFFPEELQALIAQNEGRYISDIEANYLINETEGWITGLQFSNITLPNTINLYSYFKQQILDRQSFELREFILRTAFFDEFDAHLCEMVLAPLYPQNQDWTNWINLIANNNVFALTDENRKWLRYHHLFRDFIREQIKVERQGEINQILTSLQLAYESLGEWEKAYTICLQLNDDKELVNFLIRNGNILLENGFWAVLEKWLGQLPYEILSNYQELLRLRNNIKKAPQNFLISQFMKNAGLKLRKVEGEGFIGESNLRLWEKLSPIYVHAIFNQILNQDTFDGIVKTANEVFGQILKNRIVIIIIDQQPSIRDFYQILALKSLYGLGIVLLPISTLKQSIADKNETQILKRQIDTYLGRSNLYDIRVAVTDVLSFFGRAQLMSDIDQKLRIGQPIFVLGLRKTGKSSLLLHMREEINLPIAYLDMQGYIGDLKYALRDAIELWISRINTLVNPNSVIENWPKGMEEQDISKYSTVFKQKVKEILNVLRKENRHQKLLLFLDEIDLLLNENNYFIFASTIRSIVEDPNLEKSIGVLCVGVEPDINQIDKIEKKRNPFYSFFSELPITPLSFEDTKRMIASIGAQMGIEYKEEALEMLAISGGGYPYLVRQLCSYALQNLNTYSSTLIDDSIAKQAITDYINFPRNYFAESLWESEISISQEIEKTILISLANKQPQKENELFSSNLPFEQKRAWGLAFARLRMHKLIYETENGLMFMIPIYRNWIRRHILNLSD